MQRRSYRRRLGFAVRLVGLMSIGAWRPAVAQPSRAVGTYVLVGVSGEPLPASIPIGGTYRIVLIGRRLVLQLDGTFEQTGPARVVAGRQPIALLPDARGTYRHHGDVVALAPAGGDDPIIATLRGATLTYMEGGRSWTFLQCQPVVVLSACVECHRSPDERDPMVATTFRFAEECSGTAH
jgi:hypothetical protein